MIEKGLTMAGLISMLDSLDLGIKSVLAKHDLLKYVDKSTNFAKMLHKLSYRYINASLDDNAKYDILTEAYSYVFLVAINRDTKGSLRNFTGTYNGAKISIEQYIHRLMANAVMNANKAGAADAIHYSNTQSVNAVDSESEADAFNRVTMSNSPLKKTKIQRADDIEDELAELNDYVTYIKENLDCTKDSVKKKLDKLYSKIDALEASIAGSNTIFVELDDVEEMSSAESDVEFDEMLVQVKREILKRVGPKRGSHCVRTLDLLLEGYNKSEIAKMLGVSNGNVTWISNDIVEGLCNYADNYNNEFLDLVVECA